jgi:hypothetical protein
VLIVIGMDIISRGALSIDGYFSFFPKRLSERKSFVAGL